MTNVTQGAVLFQINEQLRVVDLSVPTLKPGQVLIDVAFSGICRTQLNELRGRKGPDRFLPHCLGHEGAGTVMALGAGVTKVHVGDRVVLSWLKGSGAEVASTVYESEFGQINSGAIATFMRRTIASENRITAIPHDIPLPEAAMLGCAVPTGAGIVLNTTRMQRGSSLAVFGSGGIGLSAILAAKAVGVEKIIAVDIVSAKLEKAREFGATEVLDARNGGVLARIRATTDAKGVDYAIEAAGSADTMEMAFESVRVNGGLCVLAGNLAAGKTIRINPFSLIAGKRIIGTWGGESNPDVDLPRFVEMFRDGRLKVSALISATYSLEQINQAMEDLEAGRVLRPLIDMHRVS